MPRVHVDLWEVGVAYERGIPVYRSTGETSAKNEVESAEKGAAAHAQLVEIISQNPRCPEDSPAVNPSEASSRRKLPERSAR